MGVELRSQSSPVGRGFCHPMGALPEITPLLVSPGSTTLRNKSLAHEFLSQGSALAELELIPVPHTKSQEVVLTLHFLIPVT